MDEESVAAGAEAAVGAEEGFGGGALEEGAGFGVDGGGEEVVRGGVFDVEAEEGVEGGEVGEFGGAEGSGFGGRGGAAGEFLEFGDGAEGLNPVNSVGLGESGGGD